MPFEAPNHLDHLGEVRKLGMKPTDDLGRKMLASRSSLSKVYSLSEITSILQQTPCDYVTGYDTKLIQNQGQYGACVGASCVGASERRRYVATGEIIPLSWAWTYDQINGGRDNGAVITDSMGVVENTGIPPASAYASQPQFHARGLPPGAVAYKEDVALTLTDSLECASALLLGMFPQFPICVTRSFENWDSNGVAFGGRNSGQRNGNHSVYAAGLKIIDGKLRFRMVNSWGVQWGPFQDGTCWLDASEIDNCAEQDGAFAHASTVGGGEEAPRPA